MPEKNLQELFHCYMNGTATPEEEQALTVILEQSADREKLVQLLEQEWENLQEPIPQFGEYDVDHSWRQIVYPPAEQERTVPVFRVHFLRKWGWAAASIVLLLGFGAYLLTNNKKNTAQPVAVIKPLDIAPGRIGAILTLADGSQVVLDSLGNGVIANQNGAQVVLKNGGLAYDPAGKLTAELTYNVMTTPKGRQFQVVLPDGTRVWLNAASSLRYPTAFGGRERKVEVTGEAYFEVAENRMMPFRVNINGKADVEVLGTHFNVNAYENEESINTTLLEGAVRVGTEKPVTLAGPSQVALSDRAVILKPGQQAQIPADQKGQHGTRVINDVDIEKVMAWKNGAFNFNNMDFDAAMRQLERWYDIEVVYSGVVPSVVFKGKMDRNVQLSDVVRFLKNFGIKANLDGRKLMITDAGG